MTNVARAIAILCGVAGVACATGIVVPGSGNSGVYSVSSMPVVGSSAPMVGSGGAPVAAVDAPVVNVLAPAKTSNSVTFSSSFNTVLTGSGWIGPGGNFGYSALGSGLPLTFSGYDSRLPLGETLTGAALNLNLVIGSAIANLIDRGGAAPLNGSFLNLDLTLSTGTVTKKITLYGQTSISNFDLFANGFGADLAAGKALTITLSGVEGLSVIGANLQSPIWFSDTHTVSGPGTQNYLTLFYTTPTVGMEPAILEAPEPGTSALVGLALAFAGYLRFRKRASRAN